jgi:hypothetical protein
MAVTNQKSAQVTALDNNTGALNVSDYKGKLRFLFFSHVQSGAGDATSTVDLVKLPAGKIRLVMPLSRIYRSAFGASRVLDIGWTAYTDQNGAAVAAAPAGLVNDLDVSAAGNSNPTGVVGEHETKEFDSRDGVLLQAVVAGGTIPDGAKVSGYLVYVQD